MICTGDGYSVLHEGRVCVFTYLGQNVICYFCMSTQLFQISYISKASWMHYLLGMHSTVLTYIVSM